METWFCVLGWALSVLTITGNDLTILLVGRNRPLRTKTNAFIAWLAVADFLVGVGVVPSLFFCEISGGGCKWSRAWSSWLPDLIRWLFGYASAFNLCSLVTDRYIAIVKPLKYVTCVTPSRVIQMIFLSFFLQMIFPFCEIVVVLFLICYGIHCRCGFVSLFLSLPCNDFENKLPILILNSAINPWAYAFFKRDIKKETRKLICRAASKNDNKVNPIREAHHLTVGTCCSTL